MAIPMTRAGCQLTRVISFHQIYTPKAPGLIINPGQQSSWRNAFGQVFHLTADVGGAGAWMYLSNTRPCGH